MKKLGLRQRLFGKSKECFVIAEISANHGQNFKRAVALIRKAKECGADAVKFQTYTPDTMTIDARNRYFKIQHPKWGGQTLYELYEKAYTPWDWFGSLKREAERQGLFFFSTAFDKTSVDFLESLDVQIHKVSSFEIVDIPLIEHMAKTGKPIIISTGMASIAEIEEALNAAKRLGARDIILLKCVSSYPAPYDEMNLKAIPYLRDKFKCEVGLSDHASGSAISVAAVALGATVIEKHFTLSRSLRTPDSFFSIEPAEFSTLVSDVRAVDKAIRHSFCGITGSEKKSLIFRRSLFAVADIKKDDVFTEENIRSIRPGYGIEPKLLKTILGKHARKTIRRGTPLRHEDYR